MRTGLILFIVLVFFTAIGWNLFVGDNTKSQQQATSSFEECVDAGNAVMESYPRQCRDAVGNLFVEEVPGLNVVSYTNASEDDIVTDMVPGTTITSPLTITGEARGFWYFEASFPIVLTDWDGKIIAEGYATAQDSWMTENFVPFNAELIFTKPEYGERGTLILKRDNASGLPEHDAAIEIPVFFQ